MLPFLVFACSRQAPTPAPAVSPSEPTPAGARVLALAEEAHHCAGEEPYDEKRAADLATCVSTAMTEARRLLPTLGDGDLPPSTRIVVRLYVEELDADERRTLCASVPAEDFLPGLLDDEARAVCPP